MTSYTPAPAPHDPIYDAIFILTQEADSLSDCHTRTPGDWAGEPEAKSRYDHILAVVDALSKLRAPLADERERGYAENAAFRIWWDENQACPEHSLTTENAAHAAWQERGRRAALASAPVPTRCRSG